MSSLPPALERGKACVECRRRKQKCDGTTPSCNVCIRTNRHCRYEKPITRPVSVVLQERLSELEQKLRNLMRAPSVDTQAPYAGHSQGSLDARMRVPMEMTGRWWEVPTLAPAVHDYLFDLFKTQSYRVQYYFHIPTFVARMSADDPTERPHPGLLNAMYLMACYFSSLDPTKSVSFAAQEAYFLSKAQAALTDSLSLSDRLLDFIRGSNLVVSYLFNRGRFLEGYHVHCGNARFSLSCGLHRITHHDLQIEAPDQPATVITLLSPPASVLENGERLLAFWNIYWLDKLGCLLMGYVPALPVLSTFAKLLRNIEQDEDLRSTLPRDVEDYASCNVSDSDCQSLHNALHDPYPPERRADTYFSMFLKPMAALHAVNRLGQIYRTNPTDPDYISSLRILHTAVDRFAETLPAVPEQDENLDDDDETTARKAHERLLILRIRTITLGAVLEMNNATADTDPKAYNARLTSASYISALVFHFGEENYKEADLATGYCWCLTAQVLVEHVRRVQAAQALNAAGPSLSNSGALSLIECESQLARVLNALEKLSVVFPTLVHQVQEVQTAFSEVGSGTTTNSSGAFSTVEIQLGD